MIKLKEEYLMNKKLSNIWEALSKTDKSAWIRLIIMSIAFINQGLSMIGKSPLPISNEEVQEYVSLAFTIGASLYGFITNNPFTKKDQVAKTIATNLKEVDYDKDAYYHKYIKEDGDK